MSLYDQLLDKLSGKAYYDYFAAFCPFDEHKTPAFLVYPDGYYCMSCHRKGTLEFLAKKIGTSYTPTLTQSQSQVLPRWRSWEKQWGSLQGIAEHAHKSLLRSPKIWFKKRGINEFIEKGYFGYIDGWGVFPVYSAEHILVDIVVRAIARKGDTRYVVSPISGDLNRPLYVPNWERVEQARIVYVVMGMIDAWALEALELPVVTGITGKQIPIERLRELHKKLIIIPDLGEEEDAHRIANEFGMGARVRTLKYPSMTKDTDEVRIQYGNEYLLNLIGV